MFIDNITPILAILGFCQGILLSIYLLTAKTNSKKSNLYLGLVLFGLTVRIGKSILGYYLPLEAWQKNIGISGIFIVGPFLWFYGKSLFYKKNITSVDNLHLAPFFIFILLIPIIPSNGHFETFWNYGIVVFHLAFYLVLSWLTLFNTKKKVSPKKKKWYRTILIGVTAIWVFYLSNFLNLGLYYISGPIFYSFLIYGFTILFLNRSNFNLEKYNSSKLDHTSSVKIFEQVKKILESENIYLDSTISIKVISERLSINSREISQSVNQNTGQNFKELVNNYRIKKAKTLLSCSEQNDKKIASIAYDSGFGTITAFNIAFKKHTGITPTEFRKKYVSN